MQNLLSLVSVAKEEMWGDSKRIFLICLYRYKLVLADGDCAYMFQMQHVVRIAN